MLELCVRPSDPLHVWSGSALHLDSDSPSGRRCIQTCFNSFHSYLSNWRTTMSSGCICGTMCHDEQKNALITSLLVGQRLPVYAY